MQLHQSLYEHDISSDHVVAISFAAPEFLQRWISSVLWKEASSSVFEQTRFVANPDRSFYHAYGLGQYSRTQVYGAKVLLQYAWLALQGRSLPKTNQDPLQKGGDFVVKDNVVRLSHVGKNQSDRPSIKSIVALLQK